MPAQPAAGSTGTATILFTDLVASTTWRVQLGEERAEARRQAQHRLLADTELIAAGRAEAEQLGMAQTTCGARQTALARFLLSS
jgi:hypothetical protein